MTVLEYEVLTPLLTFEILAGLMSTFLLFVLFVFPLLIAKRVLFD